AEEDLFGNHACALAARVGTRLQIFGAQSSRPPVPLSTLRYDSSRSHRQGSRPEWSRFSFSVGLFHPLQCAGLSRRSLSRILTETFRPSPPEFRRGSAEFRF